MPSRDEQFVTFLDISTPAEADAREARRKKIGSSGTAEKIDYGTAEKLSRLGMVPPFPNRAHFALVTLNIVVENIRRPIDFRFRT